MAKNKPTLYYGHVHAQFIYSRSHKIHSFYFMFDCKEHCMVKQNSDKMVTNILNSHKVKIGEKMHQKFYYDTYCTLYISTCTCTCACMNRSFLLVQHCMTFDLGLDSSAMVLCIVAIYSGEKHKNTSYSGTRPQSV